ncbi:hypothetical protein J437_LFUL017455 [Ladona fulva]|uniref:Uncharacterized protein n=1 Tax=Ladona fulva TaxID=123851 RepID=A0A8K0KQB4_LADFU|nr:hypothetical protein J437_LFUL017455 [Ladona fulva]
MGKVWLTLLNEVEEKIRTCKVSSTTQEYVYERIDKLRELFVEMEVAMAIKETKEEVGTDIKDYLDNIVTDIHDGIRVELEGKQNKESKVSYAKVVQNLQEESKEKKELIIMNKNKDSPEDAIKIKEIIKSAIKPGQEAIKINSIRNAGKKGVIIEIQQKRTRKK